MTSWQGTLKHITSAEFCTCAGSDRAKAVGWLLRDPLLNLSQHFDHFAVLHDCLKSLPVMLPCENCFLAGAQTSVLSLQNRARSKTGQAMGLYGGSGFQNDGWKKMTL